MIILVFLISGACAGLAGVGEITGPIGQLHREVSPDLLICFNPTWGLDVGAINYIHETLIKINEQNKSIILISTDTDELLKLSDKISVIHKGKLSKIMNAEEVTSEKLGILMGGGN